MYSINLSSTFMDLEQKKKLFLHKLPCRIFDSQWFRVRMHHPHASPTITAEQCAKTVLVSPYSYCAYVLHILRYSGFLWVMPTNTGKFLRGLKRKLRGNHALFRDNKAWNLEKTPYMCTLLCILLFFRIIVALLSLKTVWLPAIFFLDSNSPYQDLLSPHLKPHKSTSLLVGTACP